MNLFVRDIVLYFSNVKLVNSENLKDPRYFTIKLFNINLK